MLLPNLVQRWRHKPVNICRQGHKRAACGVAEHHYSHICIKTIHLFTSKLFCLQAGSESHWGQKHLQERLFARTRIGRSSVVLTSAHKISERKRKSAQEEVLVLLSMKYNLRTPRTLKGEKHFKKAPCAALLTPQKEDLCPRKLSTPLCKHRKRTGVTEEQVCLLCSLQYQDYPIQCHIQLQKGALGVIELPQLKCFLSSNLSGNWLRQEREKAKGRKLVTSKIVFPWTLGRM